MSALLELTDVEARYGPVQALRGISLEVPEGAVVAVLGANGAGKTTTLRAVSGTVRRERRDPARGQAAPWGPEAVAKAGIAHVPEGRGTFTELSVVENLRLGAYTRRRPLASRADIARMAEYFPWIRERGEQRAGTLSGGEQQMLALARALMARPRLLMLDEPSLGLAPLIVREIFRIVQRAEREGRADRARRGAGREDRARGCVERVRARGGAGGRVGVERRAARRRSGAAELPRLLMAAFFQQVVSGLASGGVYGVARTRDRADPPRHGGDQLRSGRDGDVLHVHRLDADDEPRLFVLAGVRGRRSLVSFAGGFGIHQAVIRPVERGPQIRVVIITIGLLLIVNGLMTWIWSGEVRSVPSPFPTRTFDVGGVAISVQDIGTIAVSLGAVVVLWAFFQFTKVGLALRAAAVNPDEARLVGVRVPWMLGARLGARRDARGGRRHAHRAERLPRSRT